MERRSSTPSPPGAGAVSHEGAGTLPRRRPRCPRWRPSRCPSCHPPSRPTPGSLSGPAATGRSVLSLTVSTCTERHFAASCTPDSTYTTTHFMDTGGNIPAPQVLAEIHAQGSHGRAGSRPYPDNSTPSATASPRTSAPTSPDLGRSPRGSGATGKTSARKTTKDSSKSGFPDITRACDLWRHRSKVNGVKTIKGACTAGHPSNSSGSAPSPNHEPP